MFTSAEEENAALLEQVDELSARLDKTKQVNRTLRDENQALKQRNAKLSKVVAACAKRMRKNV